MAPATHRGHHPKGTRTDGLALSSYDPDGMFPLRFPRKDTDMKVPENRDNDRILADLLVQLQDHDECPGAECPIPSVLAFMAMDSPTGIGVETNIVIHKLGMDQVSGTIVKMWDGAFMDAANQSIPPYIRFAHGRELMRRAIETTETPPEVMIAMEDLGEKD